MASDFHVIIPARIASVRLPGKVLLDIAGKPMIQHVYERASQSNAAQVVIATDDRGVYDIVRSFGGEVIMTAATHQSGTDRLQEAASKLQLGGKDIIVNVQGDEPLIPPAVVNQVAENLQRDQGASVATLCAAIDDTEIFQDPNAVKVVVSAQQRALYFSRAPIPWPRENPGGLPAQQGLRHIGIYAYRVELLHRFVTWPMAPLEEVEKLEQLRVLWQGEAIHVAEAQSTVPPGVDSEADLQRVRQILSAKK